MVMLLAASVLTAAAWLRSAEYDEQYTLFLTAGTPRPAWPEAAFTAGLVRRLDPARKPDWPRSRMTFEPRTSTRRCIFGPSPSGVGSSARACSPGGCSRSCAACCHWRRWATSLRRSGIKPLLAMLLTLGSYGFVYTNAIARDFALAQTLTLCALRYWSEAGVGVPDWLPVPCSAPPAVATILPCSLRPPRRYWPAAGCMLVSAVPFLALDAWFFAAQEGARIGQFPSFDLLLALLRLLVYQAAKRIRRVAACMSTGAPGLWW